MNRRILNVLFVIFFFFFGQVNCMAADGSGELIIFHTNDMHGRIQKEDYNGQSIGLSEMAAAIKKVKSQNSATLWLDAGDTFHGMPIINLSKGENLANMLNKAGVNAMTAGNHDFDYGSKQLEKIVKRLKFPLLSANVVRKETKENLFKSYKIFELNGIKVGVFGLSTPETSYKTNPINVETVSFLNPIDVSRRMIKELRPKCDVLIGIMHIGLDVSSEFTSERIASETNGIDLIVDGHSHTALANGIRVNDTLIVQTGWHGHHLGCATITLNNHKIVSKKAKLLDAKDVNKIASEPDKKILKLITKENEKANKILDEIVAQSDRTLSSDGFLVRRNESELGNLSADAFRWKTKSDIAVINCGGLRADFPKGNVTKRDLLSIFPFGNTLKVIEIPGATIKEMLEHSVEFYPNAFGGFLAVSGMTFSFDPNATPKSRVQEILINGTPLIDGKIYTMTTNDFIFSGGDNYNMLKGLKLVGEANNCEEALIEYLNQVGIKNIGIGRITVIR